MTGIEKETGAQFFVRPCSRTLAELFDENRLYIIPGYQRPYSWDAQHIEKLMEIILDGFDNDRPVLLGTIQLNALPSDGDSKERYELIDGQQRLTTLWLLLRALTEDTPSDHVFNHENLGDERYDDDLRSADADEPGFVLNGRYRSSFVQLSSQVRPNEAAETAAPDERTGLREYLLNSVIFVEIVTAFNGADSIDRSLQIFDALNTSGMPLDSKDIFKIRLYEHLRSDKDHPDKDCIGKINLAYSTVRELGAKKDNAAWALDEHDLIDAFRFWIISHASEYVPKEMMTESYTSFFERFFTGSIGPDHTLSGCKQYFTADHLLGIAETMSTVQRILRTMDESNASASPEEKLLLCAREMLWCAGYGKLCAASYAMVYKELISANGGSLPDADSEDWPTVIKAVWGRIELTWKYALLLYSGAGRILNEVFISFGNIVLRVTGLSTGLATDNPADIAGALRERLNGSAYFTPYNRTVLAGALATDGNIFDIKKHAMFALMSYIHDCDIRGCEGLSPDEIREMSSAQIKKQHFYKSKYKTGSGRGHQIEHIASFSLNDSKPYRSAIGNLMYLEYNINEALGAATGKIAARHSEPAVYDFNYKCGLADPAKKRKDYRSSELPCVKAFLRQTDRAVETEEDIETRINKRSEEKAEFIAGLFMELAGDIRIAPNGTNRQES